MTEVTQASPVPQLQLDNQLCFALHAASRSVVRAYGPLLDELGITYPQYLAMLVLWETPDLPVAVGEIGSRLQLDSGTLTPLLKRLERGGLIRRDRDPGDERRVLIRLTDAGRALRDRAEAIPFEMGRRFGLDLAGAVRMKQELERLVAHIEAAQESAGA